MKKLIALAGVALLAACAGDEHSDLKQELGQITKDLRGRVDPLPQVKPYEPVPYKGEGEVDPFRPERINVAQVGGAAVAGSGRRPDVNRPKEPLEAFPLESISMVGTLSRSKETFGLVKAGPNLFRVRKGNYMGQNFGVITGIDDGQITLKELIQEGGGDWVERVSSLQLQEVKK
ncbi:MAG: pilus assembly protein PilP [Betaproteobacteria bacterium]|nr:pilus assembly protein PilP [Betaproteobacteria bacterium]